MNNNTFKIARSVAWSAVFVASTAFAQSSLNESLLPGAAAQAEGKVVKKDPPAPKPNKPEPKPPVTKPPVTKPPVTKPPVTKPPVTKPPVTKPPVTKPPVTKPPVTEPPVTKPPVTKPPVTEPPVTKPPVTKPPVTKPPVTKPVVTEPTAPVSDHQKQQNKDKAKQEAQKKTEEAKAKLPSNVAQKIPAGGSAKLSKDNKSVAMKDPKSGVTKVVDAKTGKPLMSYNKSTGAKPTAAPAGAKVEKAADGSKRITAPGYSKTVDAKGNAKTVIRNTTINERIVNNKTVIVNKTVVINNRTVVIHEDRPMIRTFNPYRGGYVALYTPIWWGAPAFMAEGWVITGNIHVYGLFFSLGGYYQAGYESPWRPGYGFVRWGNPYICREDRWHDYYHRWGWGWVDETFYVGYYRPVYSYPHLGWWIADYWIQRELETERLERLAAYEDAEFALEEEREFAENQAALNAANEPISPAVMERLADQAEQMVSSINAGEHVFASEEVENNHIFTVEGTLHETATIDGLTYNCKLKSGDLIEADRDAEQDVEPVLDEAGEPVVDDYGNIETNTFVTMKVVASKMHSCAINSRVVVQMDTLQTLLGEEKARIQEGMEQSILVGAQP